ncbi:hypothetical protein BBK36DRAFT_1193303 [Trichoderma citrinoviride]|uniref:Uncharacterized protein n=1 Tax=Trichoderma citrinoviride TaxID=58853 RepID=A0A2T4BIP9_9HYPO|nr:hypothetical protein BBK36DRAFT_1193303 [Trichoderma citrinoviride]PTB69129.1 hypothetical protein BBK36DRAFT_1193303 [Trichoderma citrinoviride]
MANEPYHHHATRGGRQYRDWIELKSELLANGKPTSQRIAGRAVRPSASGRHLGVFGTPSPRMPWKPPEWQIRSSCSTASRIKVARNVIVQTWTQIESVEERKDHGLGLLYSDGHEDRSSGRAKGGGCWNTGGDLTPRHRGTGISSRGGISSSELVQQAARHLAALPSTKALRCLQCGCKLAHALPTCPRAYLGSDDAMPVFLSVIPFGVESSCRDGQGG